MSQTKPDPEREVAKIKDEARTTRASKPQGYYSNAIITARNGGVRHQFTDSIGGCSANYR